MSGRSSTFTISVIREKECQAECIKKTHKPDVSYQVYVPFFVIGSDILSHKP